MKGYLKMLASEFGVWNSQATSNFIALTKDTSCTSYSFCLPDVDPLYVWARAEHVKTGNAEVDEERGNFIEGDIKTHEEAVALGMGE